MKRGTILVSVLVVWSAAIMAQTGKDTDRTTLLEKVHDYYVQQFERLDMTKFGKFGTSRIESSDIESHYRDGGDPGMHTLGWTTQVDIWGNHGKPLKDGHVSLRYSRYWSGPQKGFGEPTLKPGDIQKAKLALVDSTVKAWQSGKSVSRGVSAGGAYIEARAVRMTKPACLNCHTDMKLGQPVAVMVYAVARRPKAG